MMASLRVQIRQKAAICRSGGSLDLSLFAGAKNRAYQRAPVIALAYNFDIATHFTFVAQQ
jgi:hypothetical protein